jgi:pimeloyl-ACP methyl ester carboxylesterase
MKTVTSADGTKIAYETTGDGPPLILVDGALCYREFGGSGPLAEQLADRFTVYRYDRRGRGESGDTGPYSVDREIDDIAALIERAGGSASLYGISSGAALALEATASGLPVEKLALYEPPFIVDDSRPPQPEDLIARMEEDLVNGRRGEPVKAFMKLVEVPGVLIALTRVMPPWKKLKAVAHTLPYDLTIMRDTQRGEPLPAPRWAGVTTPTLVVDGGKSPEWMRTGQRALVAALPNARHRTLAGQTHMVKPKVLAPVLSQFFAAEEPAALAA